MGMGLDGTRWESGRPQNPGSKAGNRRCATADRAECGIWNLVRRLEHRSAAEIRAPECGIWNLVRRLPRPGRCHNLVPFIAPPRTVATEARPCRNRSFQYGGLR